MVARNRLTSESTATKSPSTPTSAIVNHPCTHETDIPIYQLASQASNSTADTLPKSTSVRLSMVIEISVSNEFELKGVQYQRYIWWKRHKCGR